MTEAEKKPEVSRPRGRKVGVRQMENVFFPDFKAIFTSFQNLLKKRYDARKIAITEIVKETIGVQEIIDEAAALAKKARDKFVEANRIYAEGKELRKAALNVANSSKVIELELKTTSSRHRYGYHDDDDDDEYEGVKSIQVKFTDEFNKLVNASMLLQREYLDLEFLQHQETEFFGKLRKCITMEQCVAVLEEVQGLVSKLETEHKKLLEKQESTNAVIERVRDEREDCNA